MRKYPGTRIAVDWNKTETLIEKCALNLPCHDPYLEIGIRVYGCGLGTYFTYICMFYGPWGYQLDHCSELGGKFNKTK